MQQHACAFVSVLEEYKGLCRTGPILIVLHILQILIFCSSAEAQPRWINVSPLSSMSTIKQHKSCMSCQSASSFRKKRTSVTVVGGGTSTAGPWDGEPSPREMMTKSLEKILFSILIICKAICCNMWQNMQTNMTDMHNMQMNMQMHLLKNMHAI